MKYKLSVWNYQMQGLNVKQINLTLKLIASLDLDKKKLTS